MNYARRATTALALTAILISSGCKKDSAPGAPSSPKPAADTAYTQIDPSTAGTISGTIHFTGKPPEAIEIDMAQDPACTLSGDKNFAEQYAVHDGKLANVYVYVKDGLGNKVYLPPSAPAVLDQKGCRYTPHVIAVMAGQPVEFRNSDPTMHNIHPAPTVGGNEAFDISQPPRGGTTQHIFRQPETMIPVRCNNHPWMNAFINVSANPFFAVTGPDGHFELKGLPPGTYTVTALHEKLGEKSAQVTVQSQSTASTDFTFAAQ